MASLSDLSFREEPRNVSDLTANIPLKDAPTGWCPVPGYPIWQVIPDVAYPWDPAVVRAMRSIDPSIVPLWVTWAYKPPKDDSNREVYVTGRHAVGWHVPYYPAQDFSVLMPTCSMLKRPTRLWKIYHESAGTDERIGGFVPWSWWMYHNLVDEFVPNGAPKMREYIKGKKEHIEKRAAAITEEQKYMQAQVSPFIERQLDQVTDTDWKMWREGGWKTARGTKPQFAVPQQGLPLIRS